MLISGNSGGDFEFNLFRFYDNTDTHLMENKY